MIAARELLDRDPAAGTTIAAAGVLMVLVLVLLQTAWPEDLAEDGYLWWHHAVLRFVFLAESALGALSVVTTKRVRPFRHVAVLSFGAAAGVLLGGSAADLFSLQTIYGLALFAAFWFLWELAALARLRSLIVALRLGTLAGVVVGYGQWRIALYYAGMGIAAGEVDVPTVDSLTIGLPPLMLFALPIAILLFLAWISSGWFLRLAGVGLTVVAVTSGAGLLLDRLGDDRQFGRAVGAGIATPSPPGVRISPSPTEMCLISVGSAVTTDETAALTGNLPRLVWRVGTFGQQTLPLEPERARAASAGTRLQENVGARIWYLPTNQVTLRRTGPGAPCRAANP